MTNTDMNQSRSRLLTISLWLAQALLLIAFGVSGWMKLTTPIPDLVQQMPWAEALPVWLVRFIGISEIAGAIGVVGPALTRIQPRLTGIAGAALTLVMVLAIAFHLARGEFGFIVVNALLGGLGLFVALGRLKWQPISSR